MLRATSWGSALRLPTPFTEPPFVLRCRGLFPAAACGLVLLATPALTAGPVAAVGAGDPAATPVPVAATPPDAAAATRDAARAVVQEAAEQAGTAPVAAGQLPLAAGDVISVVVEQAPSLNREARLDATGRITLPTVGVVDVADLPPDAAAQAIARALVERDIVLAPTVTVEVVKYRPFYVDGNVATPGSFDYQPGLSVRRALVLAGGVDTGRNPAGLSVADLMELDTAWREAAYALLEVNSRIARLQAELDRKPEIAPPEDPTGAVAAADRAAISSADGALLKDSLDNLDAEQKHLEDLRALVDYEIDVLAQQTQRHQEENALQQEEVDASRILSDKGLLSAPRMRELEREQSQLSRDLLEVQAFSARARQNKETLTHDLESANRRWRMEVQADLRDAYLDRGKAEAKLEMLRSSVVAAGIELSAEGPMGEPEPEIVIFRTVDGVEQRLAADMASAVLPGDVIQVARGRIVRR